MLTRQQQEVLRQFGNPDDPYDHSDESMSTATHCDYRRPIKKLVELGLLKETWVDAIYHDQYGRLYEITDAGREALRQLRSVAFEGERS